MSTRIETLTTEQAYDRLLANLEDADLPLWRFVALTEDACHLGCVMDWDDDRSIALEEADHYLFLLGGRAGLAKMLDSRHAWGMTA